MAQNSTEDHSGKMLETQEPPVSQVEAVDHDQLYTIDPEEERKVVRKLDCVIMPLMAVVYFFQYLDKQSINQAAIFGLRKDLALTGEQYSWAVSLFYLGQLCSEYPAMYLLSRLPISLYVGVTIVIWGGVNMAMAACHDFPGLAASRFFLGFAEGTVSPAFIIITSNWYVKREHPIRVATWISMNGVAQILGGLMMYGIGHANIALAPWRALFIICGGLTSLVGIVFIFMMPRDPSTAWFLTPRQREIATNRLAVDRATRDRTDFNRDQAREAITSPMTWLYLMMALCITLTTPIMKFSATVINGFGYDVFETMLVGMPAGALNTATVWVSALVPRMFPGTRTHTAMGLCFVPMIGSILLMTLPAEAGWGIIVSTWMGGCSSALLSSAASIIASNVKGNTKKSVVSAAFFISYCVGCIVGPFAWTQKDAPRYATGCILSLSAMIGLVITFGVFLVAAKKKNAKRDAKASEGRSEYIVEKGDGTQRAGVSTDSDMTDLQDKGFRYTI
ncbi:major facilitator superfamily domain-containing protein [Plectosphaerella cucumerina]|uniref:Major facilitator superfamily domain-containing protein n=1 Tax=Plectosphaerella cucumerina TaxID=40658 RepID=A0A8K0TK19_9PEZI|nr:major facilitator superfamily domain-containing protein [Plectosphaerella cucumerina]